MPLSCKLSLWDEVTREVFVSSYLWHNFNLKTFTKSKVFLTFKCIQILRRYLGVVIVGDFLYPVICTVVKQCSLVHPCIIQN